MHETIGAVLQPKTPPPEPPIAAGCWLDFSLSVLNSIGRLNMTIQGRWQGIKRQEMLFILSQAPHSFGVALSIFGFKRMQIDERIFLLLWFPNSAECGLDFLPFSSRDGTHDVALLVEETALTGGCRKELADSGEQSIMSVCDQQIYLRRSSCTYVLQQTEPPLFILLCTGTAWPAL